MPVTESNVGKFNRIFYHICLPPFLYSSKYSAGPVNEIILLPFSKRSAWRLKISRENGKLAPCVLTISGLPWTKKIYEIIIAYHFNLVQARPEFLKV